MFQKHLLKLIHNLVDFAYPKLEVAWLALYTLVLTSHEMFHCVKTVLVLCRRVSPISRRGSINSSFHFFQHLLGIYYVTGPAITQAEWNMTWDSLWNSGPGSYTSLQHCMDRHNCVFSLFQKEWMACCPLGGLLYCSLKARLQFGASQPIARVSLPRDTVSRPHYLPKMSWLLISHRMSLAALLQADPLALPGDLENGCHSFRIQEQMLNWEAPECKNLNLWCRQDASVCC